MKKFIKENWILILSLIYIISPIDFIPEALLGPIGIIDDLFLILVLLAFQAYKIISDTYSKRKSKYKEVIEME
ncbi:MAG: DUF1232 domain-containing protein [Candidatus Dojkabacteria bacterium]